MPPRPESVALPRTHLDALDLAAFYAPYLQQGSGNLPYEPAMMVKILVYGYATGVLSSRRLAQKLEEDVAFRVLAAGNRPQHRTNCEFRRRHREDFGAVLVAVVQLAWDLGLASLTTLVPSGTKVRAHARKQGHELWAHAAGGGAAERRNREAAGRGRGPGCGGRCPTRPGSGGR